MLWEGGFDWNPPAVTLWEISVSNASLKLYPKPINGFQHGYATFTAIQTLQSSHPPLAMLLLHWSLQCGDTSYPPTQIKKWFSSFFRLQSGLCPHSDQQKKKKKKKKNVQSAMEHADVVKDYHENEICERRVIGQWTIPAAHTNHFGGIPKFH